MDADPPSKSIQTGEKGASEPDTPRSRRRVFYGWWIVAAATFASAIQSAVYNVGAQALVLPLERDLNATRTQITLACSLSRRECGVTGPLEGYLIHWIGPRRYMMAGWVLFGLGFVLLGLAQNLYHFYGAFLLITLGQSVAGFLPIVTVLINWFYRWRGRAIAIYQLGGSIGAVMVPVWSWFILNLGWRETSIIVGIATIAIGVPLAAMMRNNPEEHGYLPDGERPQGEGEATSEAGAQSTAVAPAAADREESGTGASASRATPAARAEESMTVGQALRGGNFWFLALSHSAGITAWGALRVHQIPALVEIGINEITAATLVSYTLLVAAPGRLIGGFLGEKVGIRRVTAVAFVLQGVGLLILTFSTTMVQVVVFATVFGLSFGMRGTLMTVLRAEVFGRENFSRLAGFMDPISSVSVMLTPLFAAFIFDTTNSYQIAFLVLAVLNCSGAVLLLGLRLRPR